MSNISAGLALDLADAPDTAARIKISAVFLFARKGYAGTSIRDIAKLAGVTNAGVYHFVESKEALLIEIVREGQQLLQASTEEALQGAATPADEIASLVGVLVGAHGRNRMLSFVTDWEIRSLTPGTEAFTEIVQMRDDYEQLWSRAITAGVDAGQFTADNPRITKLSLLNMCTGVSAWYRPDGPSGLDEIVREFVHHALAVLGATGGGAANAARSIGAVDVRMPDLEAMPKSAWEPTLKRAEEQNDD